jgi:hypothetical protein
VKRGYPKILRNRKRRIQRRLDPERGWSDQAEPIMRASNIHYEMAEKARALFAGEPGDLLLGRRSYFQSGPHREDEESKPMTNE